MSQEVSKWVISYNLHTNGVYNAGQILATSHDLTPKWWFSKGNGTPYFREIVWLVKYYEPFGQNNGL